MRRVRREQDHAERLSAKDEVGGPLLRCLLEMLLVVEKRICIEKREMQRWCDSTLATEVIKLTHSCLQYSGHLHLGQRDSECRWSPETALSIDECCVLAGCVARMADRLPHKTPMCQYLSATGWEDLLVSLLEVPGTYCSECRRGVCSRLHVRCKEGEENIDPSASATRIAQVIWESGVISRLPSHLSPTTTLLYSLLFNALGADIQWPAHVLEATGLATCYALAARVGVPVPTGIRLLRPSLVPSETDSLSESASVCDYTLRSYRQEDIQSLPLSTVEEWGTLLTGVVTASTRDPTLLADLVAVMEDLRSPFVVDLSDELVVAISDLVAGVATGICTKGGDTSPLELVIQLAAAIVRAEADYHQPGEYTATIRTPIRATEGYPRRACTSAMMDAGLVGLIHTWMVAVSDGSSSDTSLADTAAACASVLDDITRDLECRVQLRQCIQAEEYLAEDLLRIRALVSDDVSKVLQKVEDRMAYRSPHNSCGIYEYPWSGWEVEQAVSG
ncbi:hypothetical protein KIPB_011859 [Kipferlia bialata]|uniref:Uncharacterized protein n=1 Tax=Kipferlia bialata TaxID=797122 RepID=A0A9K3D6E0_9EUKA|nr:hypothetical protein KIPB_011859 [Kipferlia bialata]|eukprot:g11859.t1